MENMTYEQAMTRIGEIADALEENGATLEESLKLYEEGVSLIRFCQKTLDEAELKVKKITLDENGEMKEIPFTPKRG